jgi:hypothetical protein
MLTLNIIQPKSTHNIIEKSFLDGIPKEFNGLPVVRAPKELGRRGLTNNNIIIQPSGTKISKCPNGYIILCSHDGCHSIGSKDGIKCVKHADTFRYCRISGCGKRSHFGIEKKKPLYCSNYEMQQSCIHSRSL